MDKRCGKSWQQQSLGSNHFILQVQQDQAVTLTMLDGATDQAFETTLTLFRESSGACQRRPFDSSKMIFSELRMDASFGSIFRPA